MILTYRYRIKDKHAAILNRMASAINFVWNYCNEVSYESATKHYKWLSGFDLNNLTVGCSRELGIPATTINSVCENFERCRKKSRKYKLSWRSYQRSLAWIPFKGCAIKLKGKSSAVFQKKEFHFWKSREYYDVIKSGSFNRDSRGRWFLNLQCEAKENAKSVGSNAIAIDLGFKNLATTSEGVTIKNSNHYRSLEQKLSSAQRARKKKQVTKIHAKIANRRKDDIHKLTTKLSQNHDTIFVGDVSPVRLLKTRFSKSVRDSGWGILKTMLAYKATRLGVVYKEVNEMFSTVTCSTCLQRTGPSGLSGLGVREWTCTCGAHHNRDVNAAKNILRFGHESLIKGAA